MNQRAAWTAHVEGLGLIPAVKARGRVKPAKGMNKLEAAYASELDIRMKVGEIIWYKFEAINLRLADNTFYKPDFFVLSADCALEVHETKGFWEDDARVKIKVAASIYPFKFIGVTRIAGVWKFEEF